MAEEIIIGMKQFLKYMDNLALKQLPFATSQALNSTAFKAQGIVRGEMPKRFIIRKTWTVRGILVKKATKKDLTSEVYSRDDFMLKQETGGIHKARVRRLAIPDKVRTNIRKNITMAKRPKQIVKKPKVFVMKHSIVQRKGGKKIRRTAAAGSFESKFKILYRLKKQVRIKPRFNMRKIVEGVVGRTFPAAFNAAYVRALQTARV